MMSDDAEYVPAQINRYSLSAVKRRQSEPVPHNSRLSEQSFSGYHDQRTSFDDERMNRAAIAEQIKRNNELIEKMSPVVKYKIQEFIRKQRSKKHQRRKFSLACGLQNNPQKRSSRNTRKEPPRHAHFRRPAPPPPPPPQQVMPVMTSQPMPPIHLSPHNSFHHYAILDDLE
ncbi:unnamed protein product [Caenorhabditis auriculariae]|uniref:Uncharacterized protein n=1 Tax=Caenorhabditis auriculariae TaxID=2777116 RepID=A0A8S1HT75_9PELO|nr:unnamed protein product [Caenorhabditis auriculariae]